MQKLIKAFENIMVAITFAEAGEYDEARRLPGNEMDSEEAVGSITEKIVASRQS